MAATKGFFSIIQFCPDLDRGESANVGIALVVPGLDFLGVRFSDDNEGPKQRFGRDAFDDARLALTKRALENRLRQEAANWKGPEELLIFGRKEGNHLLLSQPRVILVENAEAELEELFLRLVHVDARQRRRQPKPDLKRFFEPKLLGVPLLRDIQVDVPELGKLDVPYAYKNGALHLVRPEGFPLDRGSATDKASDLAVKGHLIYKHSANTEEPRQLIVVGGFDASIPEDVKHKIEFILSEHDTRLVREDRLDDFVEEVRREAHS